MTLIQLFQFILSISTMFWGIWREVLIPGKIPEKKPTRFTGFPQKSLQKNLMKTPR